MNEGGPNLTPYGRRMIYIYIYINIYTITYNTTHKLTRLQSLWAHQTLELCFHVCSTGACCPARSWFCTNWHVTSIVQVFPSSCHKLHSQRPGLRQGSWAYLVALSLVGYWPCLGLELSLRLESFGSGWAWHCIGTLGSCGEQYLRRRVNWSVFVAWDDLEQLRNNSKFRRCIGCDNPLLLPLAPLVAHQRFRSPVSELRLEVRSFFCCWHDHPAWGEILCRPAGILEAAVETI